MVPKIQYLMDIGISREKIVSDFDKNYVYISNVGIKRISKIISLFLRNYLNF